MPSTLFVRVVEIDDVQPHPNADRLMLATIGGWQCVVGKNEDGSASRKKGDLVVFVPPDSVMPLELADRIGVTKYLARKKDKDGNEVLVVRAQKLRGELSAGVILDVPLDVTIDGGDMASVFGIVKYEAPIRATSTVSAGQPSQQHPMFFKYDGPENYRHFVNEGILQHEEMVVITEKVHGTNSRVGIVDGEWMAGSNKVQRKNPALVESGVVLNDFQPNDLAPDWWKNDAVGANTYWWPTTHPGIRAMLECLRDAGYKQIILYGEIYGPSIFYPYGKKAGELGYVAFDLLLDGKYVDWVTLTTLCNAHGVETVPALYMGPFSHDVMQRFVGGNTTFKGANHIREGIVVKPIHDRRHPKIGRVILKHISDDYLSAKDEGRVCDATDE